MDKRFMKSILGLTLSCVLAASGQEEPSVAHLPAELDLATALNLAVRNNPALLRTRERIEEMMGRSQAIESVRWPAVGLTGTYVTEEDDRLQTFGPGAEPDADSWEAGVQFTQPLYSGGRLKAQVKAQRSEAYSLDEQVQTALLDVLTDVHRKFYDALLARESIAVRVESLSLLEQQWQLAKQRFDAGAGPRFDVLQAEVRLANARPPLLRAQNDYRLALNALRSAIGLPFDTGTEEEPIRLLGDLSGPMDVPDREAAIREALEERPERQQLKYDLEAAEYRWKERKAQHAPSLNAFGDYSFSKNRYGDDPSTLEGWRLGVRVSLPLWEGGRIRGEVREARSLIEQLRLQDEELSLAIELEVRQALHNLDVSQKILETSELVIQQATEALRLAENRFKVGEITQLDVLASQLELTQARLEQIVVSRDYRMHRVLLDRALGRVPGGEWLTPNP